jgi:hypothetical protein
METADRFDFLFVGEKESSLYKAWVKRSGFIAKKFI